MRRLALCIALLWATAVGAVEPGEVLDDPVLEARARTLSKGLRCLVCRNESIDESHADLARELRLLLRERLVAGDSDDQAMAFLVARYGEYVLLQPRATGGNLVLWASGPVLLLLGLLGGFVYLRSRRPSAAPNALSEAEQARLDELLKR